jgi:starch synthase (maltosyl-transferring)
VPRNSVAEKAEPTARPAKSAATTRRAAASGRGDPALDRLNALAAQRVAIEAVEPAVDGGRFPVKWVVGRSVVVEADVFCDGHETIDARIVWRKAGAAGWAGAAPMRMLLNDRWRGGFRLDALGLHEFAIEAWRDLFATWRTDTAKKHAAGQDVRLEVTEGRIILERTLQGSDRMGTEDRVQVEAILRRLGEAAEGDDLAILMEPETAEILSRCGLRANLSTLERPIPLWMDRERAVFSAWYELFPRSASGRTDRHGTFDDVIGRLPYVKDLGFDVLYFPPIHPIGKTNRKGKNNSLKAEPGDVGSPYAIGSEEGGHTAIHPELGSFEDFGRLVKAATEHGLEIALDVALNASPDHPWIKEHPDWFERRPDGSIKYAENPPKKYEDIVNFRYYLDEGRPNVGFWQGVRDMFLFWVGHGVTIFRVDNPHTKPLPFWKWVIEQVQAKVPEAIFLSEAFTRPKMMKRLAKIGFNQSYTYYTWRNAKWELQEYLTELSSGDMPYVMRPNFFTNTPDINPVPLQTAGRAGFRTRAIMAASLSPSWGMYNGFEICDAAPVPGKEEYLNSEKYELRAWDFDRPDHIKDDIRLINRIRAEHPALRTIEGIRFYNADNDNILYYGRFTPDLSDFLLFAVTLDPRSPQGAEIEIPIWEFGLPDHGQIGGTDLVTGQRFAWEGKMQRVWLTPYDRPYCIWSLQNPGAL